MTRGDIRPGIADAKIADAGFASQRCHRREVCVQVRTRGERGRGHGFCVALTQEEHRHGHSRRESSRRGAHRRGDRVTKVSKREARDLRLNQGMRRTRT